MLSTYRLESIIPRVTSKQTQQEGGTITLDFGEGTQQKRRSSFLPESLVNEDFESEKYSVTGTSVFKPTQPQGHATKQFCTGSKYIGEFNQLGIAGKGLYKFPHGVIYDGYFNKKGEFHGSGMLIYPAGQRVEGFWRNGKLMNGASCVTGDNIISANQYCKTPDRRFKIEIQNELAPAGEEYLTDRPNPPRSIPKGCYDVSEGFYDPKQKVIIDYKDPTRKQTLYDFGEILGEDRLQNYYMLTKDSNKDIRRKSLLSLQSDREQQVKSIPNEEKEEWIMQNCRKEWDEPTGYRPDFYETWTQGYKEGKMIWDILDDTKTENDLLIEKLSQLDEPHASSLFSFINAGDRKEEKLREDSSLRGLSSMFLREGAKTQRQKKLISKKLMMHYAMKPSTKKKSKKGHKKFFSNKFKISSDGDSLQRQNASDNSNPASQDDPNKALEHEHAVKKTSHRHVAQIKKSHHVHIAPSGINHSGI